MLKSFRQNLCSLNKLCADTNDKIEFLNEVKMSYAALKGGMMSELSRPSFDMASEGAASARKRKNLRKNDSV